jgi:ABC-type oligopeptide transport system substrate-binding subunit/catechol 2,3-dioxygenase-like lactoylglutathione lyase family enzyme
VRGVFDVQAQEPLLVKGKAEAIQTYVVQQAKPRAFRLGTRGVEGIETPMVGREAELKRLQDALYDVIEDSEHQVITITGEAGVGKSRLLYEFDSWIELLPETVRYFKGRARQEMQNLPYALLRDLFAFRFQIQDSDSAEMVRDKMVAGVSEVLGEDEQREMKAHLMGYFVGYDFSDSPHLRTLREDPQALHQQALTYMEQFLVASCHLNPTVVFLEDLQWADDSSLNVVNHLAEALPQHRLLIVAAARPALFDRRPHWGEGQTFHTRLELEALSRRDGRRLVSEILQKVEQTPDRLRDLIVTAAEGNPFFIEELIKMLIEDGVIIKREEAWRFEPTRLVEVRVPNSLTGVLQARLDRLPLAERTILQQASVVGRLFWDRAVAHIAGAAGEAAEMDGIVNSLSALREREMVFQRETSAFARAREYIFTHALLREATYASVLKKVRQVYHGLVADWLIQESGERVTEVTGMIADHLEAAGRSAQAVDYLLQAGDQARLLYAHGEAAAYYQRALELLRERHEAERAARTLMKLGLTYHTAFEFQRSRQAYDEAFALLQQAAATEQVGPLPVAPHALRVSCKEPMTLDPSLEEDEGSMVIVRQLFDGLVEVDAQLDVVPCLARDWEVTEGGRRYLIHLRDDTRWSDGQPLTAEDVVCMVQRMLHPVSGSQLASVLHCIRGAKAYNQGVVSSPESVGLCAIDGSTLVMELEEPIAYALHLLAFAHPVPRHVVEAYGDAWTEAGHIVTNGPFRLESWERGVSMTLKRDPDYQGRVRGNVDRVDLSILPQEDWAAQLALYEADELDVLDIREWPSSALDEARRRHAGEYISTPSLDTIGFGFNASRPPLDDPRVRQALAMAIDKETLSDVVLAGCGFPATGGFVPPQMPGHTPGIGLPYDAAQAQRLLADAGYPGGRGLPTIEAVVWDRPTSQRMAEFVRACWRDHLGVCSTWTGLEMRPLREAEMREPPHVGHVLYIADYPDPDNFLRVALAFYRDLIGWRNEAYDRLVENAQKTTSVRDRMQAYQEADRILMESAAIVPLYYARQLLLVKPWLRNCARSPNGLWRWKDAIIEPH